MQWRLQITALSLIAAALHGLEDPHRRSPCRRRILAYSVETGDAYAAPPPDASHSIPSPSIVHVARRTARSCLTA
jgi:hypothetical protein